MTRQPPLTGAERQRRYRARLQKAAPRDDIVVTSAVTVTSPVTCDDTVPGHPGDIEDEAFDLYVTPSRDAVTVPWWIALLIYAAVSVASAAVVVVPIYLATRNLDLHRAGTIQHHAQTVPWAPR
jgi:hypothetical protein